MDECGARGLVWDRVAMQHALGFFPEVLKLAGGQFEGSPFDLHPSQAFIIGSLFGWKRASDGRRRFRRAYIEQGKGNGKSPLAAGIGMYCLTSDKEPRAEVYAAASMKSQAMVMFRDAVAMWQQSEALRSVLTPSGGNPIWEKNSFVCSLDDSDDPLNNPACWIKANPLLGVTITEDYLTGVVKQAKQLPGKLNNILRLHFCHWTDTQDAWMSRETLESVQADFDPAMHSGEDVFVGLDLSATQDMTAIGYMVQTGTDTEHRPTFDAWIEAWTPAATVSERGLRDKAPYDLWIENEHLNATPGKVIGFDYVAARLAEASSLYSIKALAYDTYGFNKHFEPELDALGLTMPIVEHPQGGKKKGKTGLWMPGSKLTLESLILEKRIRIRRNPVLISAMMSAATENDPFGNFWFSKRKATNRIDALIALAMAVGAATVPSEVKPSPTYEMFVIN
jgi:phage terminase large subunit-like protein